MAYHIKKTSIVGDVGIVYYKGTRRWSDKYADRKVYSDDPSDLLINPDGKNGGWTGASVVTE